MFDWSHYKKFSIDIYDNLSEIQPLLKDSAKRTIISRVYYAYFHKIKHFNEYFELQGQIYSKDSHEETLFKIKKYQTDKLEKKELSTLCNNLIELKGYRNQADYQASTNFSDEKMHYIINDLVEAIDILIEKLY